MLTEILQSPYCGVFVVLTVVAALAIIGLIIQAVIHHRTVVKLSSIDHKVGDMTQESEQLKDFLMIAISDNIVDILEINLDTFTYVFLSKEDDFTVKNTSAHLDWEELLNMIIPRIHPLDRPKYLDVFSKKALMGYSEGTVKRVRYRMGFNIRARVDAGKGKFFWYTSTIRIWKKDGLLHAVVSTIDETNAIAEERKRQEMLEDALRNAKRAGQAKSTFLFNMSHDIRTPMNAVLGFTTIAQKHIDDKEKVAECLAKIQSSGDHLLKLINDILEMSSIEYGKTTIELVPCNLFQKTERLVAMLQNQMEENGLTFEYQVNVSDAGVMCDQLRMDQVMLNLLGNAMKFTPRGGRVTFTVNQCGKKDDGRTIFEWRIKDTGIGMDASFQKVMFEPFERERSSTDSGIQGTGLGLSITKSMVELMGGIISVISEKNVGTEFIVSIPLETIGETVEPEEKVKEEFNFDGKRVLLVEDNELNSEIAEEILRDEGILVETAGDGYVALQKVMENKAGYYDLILMDIQMPVMDGYQATKEIRALQDPKKASVPIIAMTANAFEEDKRRALDCGMQAHISKPINVALLLETAYQFMQ